MKIGIFISPRHRVPPDENKILAPWYLVFDLVNGLAKKGEQVYLFAAKTSKTDGILIDGGIEPTFLFKKRMSLSEYKEYIKRMDQLLVSRMVETAKKESIGILHIHQLESVYDLIKNDDNNIQFVFTLHDPISEEKFRLIKELDTLPNCHFVSISDSQRKGLSFRFVDTVYNGIRPADWVFQDRSSDYLLHMGRLVPEKGLDDAIKTALRLNMQLEIGTDFHDDNIRTDYYENKIKPFLTNPFIGEPGIVKGEDKILLYKQAWALLFPILWEEPFGLVMIEAMVCGTPVIGYARGSVPEVVVDGVTGFIVNSSPKDKRGDWIIKETGIEGLISAVKKINSMSKEEYGMMRLNCRRHVEKKFTVEKMVEGYERVYKKVLHDKHMTR